jgi:hypothetical protein
MSRILVTNATLYSLLQTVNVTVMTVHANQKQIIMPDLQTLALRIMALESKLAVLDAKLDQISLQVTPPETGNFNPETATITHKE